MYHYDRSFDKQVALLIQGLQPNIISEKQREKVCALISTLFADIGAKIYLFGSVPLKTYLPDGDIDIR